MGPCCIKLVLIKFKKCFWFIQIPKEKIAGTLEVIMNNFTLTSSSLNTDQLIPNEFVFDGMGCRGNNLSPSLEWQNPPAATKSFAVMVHDPDAPRPGGWWHWAVINIPSQVTHLEEGASGSDSLAREALELTTDFNQNRYGGPCPPQGDKAHRYVFSVYALKVGKIEVPPSQKASQIIENLEQESLAKATLIVKYQRQ
jgi:Raf kinase inhibitor-like YbhB/YbcL family protein